jgi:hypothetical protein
MFCLLMQIHVQITQEGIDMDSETSNSITMTLANSSKSTVLQLKFGQTRAVVLQRQMSA